MTKTQKLTFKDYINISIWSLKINWDVSPFVTITLLLSRIYYNLVPIINTYVIAKIIDKLIETVSTGKSSIKEIIPLVITVAIFDLLGILVDSVSEYSNRMNWRLVQPYLHRMHYQKINELGIQTIQLPEVANKNLLVNEWLFSLPEVHRVILKVISAFIQTVTVILVLINISWGLIILLFIGSLLNFFKEKHFFKKDWEIQTKDETIEARRTNDGIRYFLSKPDTVEEIKLIGAYDFLDRKFKRFYMYYNQKIGKVIKAANFWGFVMQSINTIVLSVGTLHIFNLVLNGTISIGITTFYISSIKSLYDGLSSMFYNLVYLRDNIVKQKDLYEFFNMKPRVEDGDIKLKRLKTPPSIEFKNVYFHYPNSKRDVIRNLSLEINSKDKIAFVGENGAGKSTLVKLICRIYDPQKGEILVNGINIKELALNDWYKNIGVLLQDFNFYPFLTARENIYIGKTKKKFDIRKGRESKKNADAESFIKKLPKGDNTVMSDRYKGGINPSRGQKQKIAVARFFYRDAPLAIFDEPTSAIDADAEFRIFNRIYNFFDNKTVIIISHRFSTVRKADRIFVIKNGKIAEQGNHKELMAKNGIYADNFNKQAQGYNSD
jgi:ATP-binding cassette subfamily B protein